MNPKQQREVEILTRLEAGALDPGSAAMLLGVSPRQIRRLRVRFRQGGFAAVIHGNAGRSPAHRTDPALLERILALAGPEGKYRDLNVCHLQEFLEQQEQICLGRSTLDRLLKQAGVRQAGKAPAPVHRRKRLRRPAEGMLLQIDASPHDWLEGRGPVMSLIGGIDDATGTVPFALFRPQEDSAGYFVLLRGIVLRKGIPLALYHDRHSIFEPSAREPMSLEEQLRGHRDPTQFGRLLEELGIASIAARSPQGKD